MIVLRIHTPGFRDITGGVRRSQAFSRKALAALAACLGAGLAGGCAISIPVAGLSPAASEDVTGSIAKPVTTFSRKLEAEDWRRARSAMGVALDPQANGAAARWDNPESGLNGSFQPVGLPYPADGLVCRAFVASVDGARGREDLQGSACKEGAGEWDVKDVRPFRRT